MPSVTTDLPTTTSPLLDTDLFTPEEVITASLISELSYDRGDMTAADVGDNWAPLDLSLTDAEGNYVNGQAAAVVLINDGGTPEDTSDDQLAIGFRGTDVDNPIWDVLTYWTLDVARLRGQYFTDLQPVVEEALEYAEDNGITDVLLTGHSLGGAGVTGAYDWLGSDGVTYDDTLTIEGITFNSPISGLIPDAPVVEYNYANDFIGGLLGPDAPNVIDNIWYAVNPEDVAPQYQGGDFVGWLSQTLQAFTSPAHDIARFPETLEHLADSPVHTYVGTDDFLVIDATSGPVSVDAIAAQSPEAAALLDAAGVVGVLGSDVADILSGSYKTDVMDGAMGDDVMAGNAGDDLMFGAEGNDTMYGGAGNDTMIGGAGRDMLEGGEGDDCLEGGGERDEFTFAGVIGDDTVIDWGKGDTLIFTVGGQDTKIGNLKQFESWVDKTPEVSVDTDAGSTLKIELAFENDLSGTITFEGVESWEHDGAMA